MNEARQVQVIVLAAGKGTRMGELQVPKVLVELRGKPLLGYLLENTSEIVSPKDTILVVGFKHEEVRKVFGDEYTYALQTEQFGTAHAVLSAREKVSAENVVVLYGDMPFVKPESLNGLVKTHTENKAKITLFTSVVPNFDGEYQGLANYGRIIRDSETGTFERIVENRDANEEQKLIKEINPGIYMFNSEWLFERLPKIGKKNDQGEFYLTDIAEMAITEGLKIRSIRITPEEILGVNNKLDLELAEKVV